jgi:formylglycine-generating enzyme required for sulfatase activity
VVNPDLRDDGIDAWRALHDTLAEPLRSFLHPEPLRLLDEVDKPATNHQRREEIGLRLHQMGDPRRGVGLRPDGLPDILWMPVGAGEVTLQTRAKEQFTFTVDAFEMARYPVTWRQYRAFIDSPDGFRNPRWWQGLAADDDHRAHPGDPKWAFDSHPVIEVSWYDAMAFCRWLTERLGEPVRLPTEWEWQWAATREGGVGYPWPGDWDPGRANSGVSGIGRTVAVGLYPAGRSAWGLDDLSGNVWEWCLNEHRAPMRTDPSGSGARVLRGGSWSLGAGGLRVAARDDDLPDLRFGFIGLRVCRASPILNRRARRR